MTRLGQGAGAQELAVPGGGFGGASAAAGRAAGRRLVIVVGSFPAPSETFIVNKLLGLLRAGWDVQVVAKRSDRAGWERFPELERAGARRRLHVVRPPRRRALLVAGAPVALMRCMARNPAGTVRYLARAWRRGPGVLREFVRDAELIALRPSLVHFEFGGLARGRMDLQMRLGAKVLVSFRGYDLNFGGLGDPGYYQDVWEGAGALHLVCHDLWRRAQARGCPPSKPHCIIPAAIDAGFFDPGNRRHTDVAGTPDRPLRILSVGRLEWGKGYEYGLQAVRELVDQGVCCEHRVIGDGGSRDAVVFASRQLRLEGVVELLGIQPREQVRAQALWADVLLHASVWEGICNVALEAQAMRLPVVCSDAGGLSENVVDGETGYVAPRRDPHALAVRLAALARDPALRQRMGQAGRERVVAHFQLQDQIEAFSQLYARLLADEES